MNETGGEKPKIIIDEDWKSQVQAEKAAAEQQKQEEPPASDDTAEPAGQMPPASLPVLLSTLATQALMCLGQMPNPATGKPELSLPQAKHFIDMLQMLQEKTDGNRTGEESQLLENLLHELRMAYVAIQRQPPPTAAPSKPNPVASGE